ncbi:S8 family serine peptidase [Actinoplanes sp. CA-030573]|uniref:S8 family serine peptidase n=1 Tax=Actinoplanes sp. CA-030573 TaxID=3239898 RepID=UPI003D8EEE7D
MGRHRIDPYAVAAIHGEEAGPSMHFTPRRIAVTGLVTAIVAAGLAGAQANAFADTRNTPPVHLVVGYKHGAATTSAVRTMSAAGASRRDLGDLNATTVQVPAARSKSMIASLKADPGVAYVEVDHVRKAYGDLLPNDPMFAANLQPELKEVGLPATWHSTTGSSAVTVAVIDTGVTAVGDLAGAVTAGYDFVHNDATPTDDVGHGTTVASLVAARGNNGQGMAGVCWQCKIMPVKVLDRTGSGTDSTIANGITWAAKNGARIINLSLGGPDYGQVLADAIAFANRNGVLVVAAAGNENTSAKSYPAALPDVLAVGATNRCPNFDTDPTCTTGTNSRAPFTNGSSEWVDVAAPGIVAGMDPNGNYSTGEAGTSFSSPIVAGIAGLVKAVHPSWQSWSMEHAIESTATPIGGWLKFGKVNAAKAIWAGTDTTPPTSTGISPAENAKVRGTVTVTPLNVADNMSGIRLAYLFVDNEVYVGQGIAAPWSVKWNSAGRKGSVKLTVKLYDKAGNLRTLTRTVIADN